MSHYKPIRHTKTHVRKRPYPYPVSFHYDKQQSHDRVIRNVYIIVKKQEIGNFTIEGKGEGECFGTGHTCSMSIHIDEGTNNQGAVYRGRGWAKKMIQVMTQNIRRDCPGISDDQKLFIDTDASVGFWDKIGMTDNPYYEMEDDEPLTAKELADGVTMGVNFRGSPIKIVEGRGYEKVITFRALEQFGQSGGRHNTRRHKTQRHKTRWHKN